MPLDFKNTKPSTQRNLPASTRTENIHTEQVRPQGLEGKDLRVHFVNAENASIRW